ncbi:MAG: two-component regulator propeller domain-containing protein [Bryobacteraceae bacterium]
MRSREHTYPGRLGCLALISLVLGALPLLALDKSKELNHYGRQTWRTESGLPQNTIHAILQTHDGYLWLATEDGVVRFDGLKFVVFDSQNTPQLRSNNIRSLLEDRERNLWIGTADGLTRFNGSGFETFTTGQGLPSNSIWSTYQDRSGALWALTADGLARYRGNRFQAYSSRSGLSISIAGMAEDSRGSLWIGTQDGVKLFADGGFSDPPFSGSLPHGNISAILADASGRIWIGAPTGLSVYQDGNVTTYTVHDGLPSNRIAALYQDRNGTVWVSTDAGLARISENAIQRFPANDPLYGSIVLSIFEDREGSLWLGTDSDGLTVLRDQRFTSYGRKEGLPDDFVRCIFHDRNGVVWIGTNNGGLDRFENGRFSALTTKDGLSSNVILSLAEDSAGSLLVGTPDGLNIVRKSAKGSSGPIQILTSADGLADDFVRSIYKDADDSLWIGTRRGLSHWTKQGFRTYTQADGLGNDVVGALLRDHEGNLWIGTLRGLTRFNAGRFTNYTVKDGLSSNVITALAEDENHVVWIGTKDAQSNHGGLNRFQSGKIFRYPSSLGIPDVIYGILEDSRQNLWLPAKTGIFKISRNQLNGFAEGRTSSINVASYGPIDGLRVSECSGGGHPAASASPDGTLWFATLRGVATINSQQSELNHSPPPVALESVYVDDQVLNPARATDISPGHSRFSFEYAGLSFIAPRNVRFRYKLEGFDRDWNNAGTRRVAYYTNLSPGRYRFRVQARKHEGLWNESGASFAFRLRPRFYQTYWFYFLLLLASILLIWQIYRWRVKQVEAQFNAVLAERNRIAREIHDTLAQGFVAVSIQLELVARTLSISTDSAHQLLKQVQHLVQNSLAEARRSIWELRSQGSNDEDLPSRLSKITAQVTSTTPIKVRFQVLGTYRRLPQDVEHELLKIGQEAVANVVRHADANHVNIDLNFEAKKLKLAIVDDGRGFVGDPSSFYSNGHFGLKGMRERAERIDAKLTVKSAAGEGTQVLIETEID